MKADDGKSVDLERLILEPSMLRKEVKLEGKDISFDDKDIIGQGRAKKGLERFVRTRSQGFDDFNCYVMGIESVKDIKPVIEFLENRRDDSFIPEDIVYVNGFSQEKNQVILLPTGSGKILSEKIDAFVDSIKAVYEETLQKTKKKLNEDITVGLKAKLEGLQKEAQALGFDFYIDQP